MIRKIYSTQSQVIQNKRLIFTNRQLETWNKFNKRIWERNSEKESEDESEWNRGMGGPFIYPKQTPMVNLTMRAWCQLKWHQYWWSPTYRLVVIIKIQILIVSGHMWDVPTSLPQVSSILVETGWSASQSVLTGIVHFV